ANEDPLGKRIDMEDVGNPVYSEIVGVVGDVKYKGLGAETQPTLYQPILQNSSRGIYLIVKTRTADPVSLAAAVRQEVRTLDPQLPITGISTLEQRLYTSVAQPRFRTTLIALFAALALVLAGLGIYGVLAYAVAQRTHEIGIRLALGAQQKQVLQLVIGQGMKLAVIGVVIGLVAALTLTRLMQELLYEVSPTDPLTFVGVALLSSFVAMLACWFPARRATKVDPMVALRCE
ncbi:MAG: FtsX-like permease family protein, partial [Blastocatellia bacterium]